MDNIEIKRRTIPERLRYMAKKLNEPMDCNIQAMAMSLEMTADEMEKTEAADRAIRDLEKTELDGDLAGANSLLVEVAKEFLQKKFADGEENPSVDILEVFKTKILKDFARWYNEHKSEFDAETISRANNTHSETDDAELDMFVIVSRYQESTNEI